LPDAADSVYFVRMFVTMQRTHRRRTRGVAAGALVLLGARAAAAQDRQITVDLRPIAATVGYARRVAPARLVGFEAGFGFPQIEQTLAPRGEGFRDFEEYLHLSLFVRFVRSERVESDVGVRVSVADVTSCDASDCLPGLFGGAYASAFYGRRRLKVGALVATGRARAPGGRGSTVVNVSPLIVRLTF
jgi:hypothetical protein